MLSRSRAARAAIVLLAIVCAACGPSRNDDTVSAGTVADCSGRTTLTGDGRRRLEALAAGRTLAVPPGCLIRLAAPAAGQAALTLPAGAVVACGPGGGFAASVRACAGGPNPGAACDDDGACVDGARCEGAAFAPSAEATYTMLDAADAARVAVLGCELWVGDAAGGGRIVALDLSRAANALVERVRVRDHRRGTSVIVRDGVVREVDNASGSNAAGPDVGLVVQGRARISESVVQATGVAVDLRGERAAIRDTDVTAIAAGGIGVRVAEVGQRVDRVTVTAAGICVQLASPIANSGSRVRGLVCRGTDAKGTIGVEIASGGQYAIDGNFLGVFNPIYQGHLGGNFTVDFASRLAFGCGPKVVLQSFGARVSGYGAWGSGACGYCSGGSARNTVCDVADDCGTGRCFGGRCAGGKRNAQPCDCPGSSCTPFPVVLLGTWKPKMTPIAHGEVRGALLHTSSPGTPLVAAMPATRRCADGTRAYEACTADEDCPAGCGPSATNAEASCAGPTDCGCDDDADCVGGTCAAGRCTGGRVCGGGRCVAQQHTELTIADLKLMSRRPGAIAIDLANLSRDTSCRNCIVRGAEVQVSGPDTVGFRFPADPAGLVDFQMRSVSFDPTLADKLQGWRWEMGTIVGSGPLDPDDDQVEPLRYTNDDTEALLPGDVVALSPRAANAVRRARGGTDAVGCALDGAAPGAVTQIATAGSATCRATDLPVAPGTRLRQSAVPGRFEAATASASAVAFAQAPSVDAGDHHTVRVLLRPSGAMTARR